MTDDPQELSKRAADAAGDEAPDPLGEDAEPTPAPLSLGATVRRDLVRGVRAGLETFWTLARAMIPAYFLALLLERLGIVAGLARVTAPLLRVVGLPGEAALPLAIGYALNIYAAVGSMQPLHLDGREITLLALACLIGHNLLVEGAVIRKTGMSGVGFGFLRAFAGLAAAGLANLLMRVF